MPRIRAKVFAAATAATTAVMIAACAHNDQSVVILGVAAPPKPNDTGVCLFDPATKEQLFSGKVDVAIAKSYELVLRVENNIVKGANPDKVKAESNTILLTGATVKLTRPTGETIDEFTNLSSATVKAAQGSTPTPGVMKAVAISPKAAQILHDEIRRRDAEVVVIANIKVFGRTLGGIDVESNEYPFPITVVRGKYINFACAPAGARTCAGTTPPTDAKDACKAGCVLGQDTATACQFCTGNDPACSPDVNDY